MKTMITFLLSFFSLALAAQRVTLSFQGDANRAQPYQVVIDGVSYYSASSVATDGRQITTIENLSEGSHELEVYAITNGGTGSADGTTSRPTARALYTKTFDLRQGYDLNISVRRNGQVSFTEKRSERELSTGSGTPMTTRAFTQLVQTITAKRYQSDKIILVKAALTTEGNFFTSAQLRQLLSLLTAESRKLELAKLSYPKVTDPENFSSVYDVLRSEASKEALDNYVVEQGGAIETTETHPAYGTAMANASFTQLLKKVRSYSFQPDRISEIRTALENSDNYFSTAQLRQLLPLVSAETERLLLAKLAYNRVVDRNAYSRLVDLFYLQSSRTEFTAFLAENSGVGRPSAGNSPSAQPMTEAAFMQVYNSARNHFFQRNTVTEIQTAFSATGNYFTTEQAGTLLQLVSAEATRLPLAKLAYARIVDRQNYSHLLGLFALPSNRAELENYIRSKQ